jgi:transcriptional regulator with XRE-family HTH domain
LLDFIVHLVYYLSMVNDKHPQLEAHPLRAYRKHHNKSAAAVGNPVGLGANYIYRIERGEIAVHRPLALRLYQATGVKPWVFVFPEFFVGETTVE